jgi:hypothetical protein
MKPEQLNPTSLFKNIRNESHVVLSQNFVTRRSNFEYPFHSARQITSLMFIRLERNEIKLRRQ